MKSVITLVSNSKGLVKYLFLFLVFLNVILSAGYSQSKIHGKILDTTGKPVSNANVLLLNSKDSVLVKGMLTTEEGTYSFENVNTGAYLISATHTGANLVYSKPFEIVLKTETINLGILRLEESSVVLAGVTVTAKKPLFEQKIDRMVINVAASITYAGTNALDVLERSPGIIVNRFTNSLSINGKSGVIVMINGKRNYMDIAAIIQMLAGMPSDNIERIEVITTPPANYDADGNAGIINIVLKSNNQFGTNGSYSLTAGYNKGEQNSLSINMNHRKGKINLFGNYTYSRTRLYQLWTNYHAVDNGGIFMENYSESNRNGLVWLHDGQAGIDYQVTKKTIVGVLFTGSYRHWSMVADNYSYIYNNHDLDTSVSIINNELHTTGSYGINFNLQHNFKSDEKLTINFDYLDYYDKNPNDYVNNYYDANENFLITENVRSDKKTPLQFWIGTLDYEKKLSEKINIEAGLKGTDSRLTNDVTVETYSPNGWTADTILSGYHEFNETIGAAYSSVSINFNKKTSLKLGFRYENASSDLGTASMKNLIERNYSNVFPSFFFLHKFNDSNSFNFSYSRRIWRPSFADLAPWVIFYDPKTFQTGNPALLPTITDAINISYTYIDKILTLSYSYMTNPINNQPLLEETTNRLINTFSNSKSFQHFAVNLSLPFKITKWWSMQNNLWGNWRQTNGYYKDDIIQEYLNFYLYSMQTFNLPKDISLQLSGFYSTKGGWGLYTFSPIGSIDLGVQKKFEKLKSLLTFNMRNILNSLKSDSYISIPEQNLVVRNSGVYSYTGFSITYNHRFGKDTVKGKRERATGAEDERGRAY